jgi:hypothetical protein
MSGPPRFDVFGRIVIVERCGDKWHVFAVDSDGKRSRADVVIPPFVEEEELAQYLDDLYHESATPQHSSVRRLP